MSRSAGAGRPLRSGWLSYFRPFRASITAIVVLSVVGAQAEAATLVILAPAALAIASGEPSFTGSVGSFSIDVAVSTLLWCAAGAILVAGIAALITAWVRARLIAHWERQQRDEFIDEYLDADLPTQQLARSGEIEVQFSVYVGRGGLALLAFTQLIKSVFSIATFAVTSLLVDWRGTVALAGCGVLFVVLLRPVNVRIKRLSGALANVGLSYASNLSQASRSIRDLRVFNARDVFRQRLKSYSARGARIQQRQAIATSIATPLYQYLGLAIVVGILTLALNVPSLGVAPLATIGLLLLRGNSYGQAAQNAYQSMAESVPYFDNVIEARTLFAENLETSGERELGRVEHIDLDAVSYAYNDEGPALSDVTLRLTTGETVGIVGPSGSGKSTLAQILLRMRRPGGGALAVNGTDAIEFSLASWYRRVTFVPQQCVLVEGSVADNIRFFDDTIDDEAMRAAAAAAGVLDVIEGLPLGFATLVGPTTRDLSGGQIQRIGIARALVRDADVVVLDEPTSALDHSSEAVIQETLRMLKGKALIVVIAHRISTLSNCDRIVAMDHGRVSAVGTISEVAGTNHFFAEALRRGNLDLVGGPPE